MGTWDVGMRSNDSAAGAVYVFRDRINNMSFKGQGVLPLLRDVAVHYKRSPDIVACILGVTQVLLDRDVTIPPAARRFLVPWIGEAVVSIPVEGWEDPDARLLAIGRFANQAMGGKVSTKGDNKPLLQGIRNIMNRRRYATGD